MGAVGVRRGEWRVMVLSTAVAVLAAWMAARLVVVEEVYGVVVDAGSTGTRANICVFEEVPGQGLRLYRHRYVEVPKGLALTEDVNELLEPLLAAIREEVPKDMQASTPIHLRATAGLRLTGEEKAEALLQDTRSVLGRSGFHFKEDFVSIIDGSDEGIFAWATVNELLSVTGSVGTIDLGGGSVQLTYAVEDDSHATRKLSLGGKPVKVSSYSHLGYGLRTFRKTLYDHFSIRNALDKNPCLAPGEEAEVGVGLDGQVISSRGSGNFDSCVDAIVQIFDLRDPQSGDVCSPNDDTCALDGVLRPRPRGRFIAFAFFYDVVVRNAGMPTDSRLEDVRERGLRACAESSDPASCGDLAYIYALLHHGLKLNDSEVELRFQQEIDGVMIGWAVGALLNYLKA
mmetsp:Transcript_6497/g.19724  ORF Transcript_6497/g.19724 Transcript_6497/m.19724 type:complete len:400 (+) Transcript_6497:110-1309(+)